MTTETLEIYDSAVESPQQREAHTGAWWLEVAELRERIERRRESERERRLGGQGRRRVAIEGRGADAPAAHAPASWPAPRERARRSASPGSRRTARSLRGPSSGADWLAAKPDRLAAWAVALGFLLVIAGLLSAH
ncbi:MAG TPA: hypothetical protein VKU89_10215 [Solirubrobacteraceae bacterium]|nr:hypothetical protein [Solirubrobacteraceae bacterium]